MKELHELPEIVMKNNFIPSKTVIENDNYKNQDRVDVDEKVLKYSR